MVLRKSVGNTSDQKFYNHRMWEIHSYKLAQIAFDLGWDFVPKYYPKIEDSRQRDQIKQALHSHKQNIVEGSSV